MDSTGTSKLHSNTPNVLFITSNLWELVWNTTTTPRCYWHITFLEYVIPLSDLMRLDFCIIFSSQISRCVGSSCTWSSVDCWSALIQFRRKKIKPQQLSPFCPVHPMLHLRLSWPLSHLQQRPIYPLILALNLPLTSLRPHGAISFTRRNVFKNSWWPADWS